MAISVNYTTKPYLITIPQSDCTLVSGTRYTMTVDKLWELLRDYADDPIGRSYPITYRRIPATSSTPKITEINENFYQAQFENGNWSVDLIEGNTNFRDVEVKNNVSVGTNNTTGYSIVEAASNLTAADVWAHVLEGTMGADEMMRIMASVLWGKVSGMDTQNPVFRSIMDTKTRVTATTDEYGNRTSTTMDGS